MYAMSVTAAVFQSEMSVLNRARELNRLLMFVTKLVSQSAIA